MVDVDIDVCYYSRQKVLEYLSEKFLGKTSKVLTLNTLSSKLLIKECGKIIAEESEQEVNKVSAMIPKIFGNVKDIVETYDEVDEFKDWVNSSEIRKRGVLNR